MTTAVLEVLLPELGAPGLPMSSVGLSLASLTTVLSCEAGFCSSFGDRNVPGSCTTVSRAISGSTISADTSVILLTGPSDSTAVELAAACAAGIGYLADSVPVALCIPEAGVERRFLGTARGALCCGF